MGSLKILLEELNQYTTEPVRLKIDSLSQMDLRCIRRLYSDKGVDQIVIRVIEFLGEWNEDVSRSPQNYNSKSNSTNARKRRIMDTRKMPIRDGLN